MPSGLECTLLSSQAEQPTPYNSAESQCPDGAIVPHDRTPNFPICVLLLSGITPLLFQDCPPAAREDRPCSRHGAASPIRNGTPSKSKRSGDSGRPAAQPAGVGAKKGSKQPYEPQRLGEALLEAFLEKEGEGLELAVKFVCSRRVCDGAFLFAPGGRAPGALCCQSS